MKLGVGERLGDPGGTWGRAKNMSKTYYIKKIKIIKKENLHILYVTIEDTNMAIIWGLALLCSVSRVFSGHKYSRHRQIAA